MFVMQHLFLMPAEKKKKNKFLQRLRNKYRLVVIDDNSFEEKISLRLSRMNVFIGIVLVSLLLVVITSFIIAFTPLREYIPGYGSYKSDRMLRELVLKSDSMDQDLKNKDLYIQNIKNIMEGKEVVDSFPLKSDSSTKNYDNISFTKSKEDSLLRLEMEQQDKYNLLSTGETESSTASSILNVFFFTPLKGIITSNYDPSSDHFGIDIVAEKDAAIKAALDGTVIFSGWTLKTGNTIAIQHTDNLITVYKHNSALLKKEGDFVKAGEAIAIIGESGEQSTGPHLHFELWYDGNAVNPKDYMVFQ